MACKCNKDKFKEEFLKKLKESRRNIDNKLENPLFVAGYIGIYTMNELVFKLKELSNDLFDIRNKLDGFGSTGGINERD